MLHSFTAQTNVKYAYLTEEYLVHGEVEGEFRLLQCERQVSANDIGADIVCVVLCHQSRRYVNADNC